MGYKHRASTTPASPRKSMGRRVIISLLGILLILLLFGWHQWRDITDIYHRALSIERANQHSHQLHSIELKTQRLAMLVHDFLINGTPDYPPAYRQLSQMLRQQDDDPVFHQLLRRMDRTAAAIFALPAATENMEGPLLLHDLDTVMADISQRIATSHQQLDHSVNGDLHMINGLQRDMRDDFLFSLIFIASLLLTLALYMYRRVIRPLAVLQHEVERSRRSLQPPVCPDFGDNELGELARALNRLGKEVQDHQQALSQARSLLAHQEKMQALGMLSASIAHELGNPLAAAMVSLNVAQRKLEKRDADACNQQLTKAEESLQRAESIIHNMLNFSRPGAEGMQHKPPLQPLISEAINLLRLGRHGQAVTFRVSCPATLPAFSVNIDMLRQVLVNLLVNACHASPQGGSIHIHVWSNEALHIDVKDEGHGIDAAHQQALFSPLFTTREQGEGSGLGLAISRDLMRRMGGDLQLVESSADGSVFRISIPVEARC